MSNEQRQSFRIRVPEELEQAVLRVGGRTVTVRMIDESAGGFAISSAKPISASQGEILRLRTSAGWHEVKVIHVVPCDNGVIVGLVRLQDLDDPRQLNARIATWRDYLFLPQFSPPSRSSAGSSLSAFACFGFALVLLIFVVNSMANYRPPAANERIIPSPQMIFSGVSEQVRKTQESVTKLAGSTKKIELSPALAKILSPDVASKLGLSPNQRQQLESLGGSSATTNGEDPSTEVFGVLTSEQAAQWRQLKTEQ